MSDRLTPEREAEIAARAGHLYEYVSQHNEDWDELAGEDVPALLAELAALRAQVADLESEREKLVRWHGEDGKTINRLVARFERRQAELVALRNDALNMRGSLAPADGPRKMPFELGETLAPAVDWLIARVAELERPAVEAERDEVRESYAGLIAQCREDRDYESAFDVECRLREREEQWKREDGAVA